MKFIFLDFDDVLDTVEENRLGGYSTHETYFKCTQDVPRVRSGRTITFSVFLW